MNVLRLREEQLRVLLENVQDIILVIEEEGTIAYASPSVRRALGYAPEDLMGAMFYDFIHPDDERALRGTAPEWGGRGFGRGSVVRFRHRDGVWRVLEADWRRVEGFGDRILSARDITERRWAEEALRESEQQYRALIEQSADAIYVLQDGVFVLVNRAWENLFGYARAEALSPAFDPMRLVAPHARAQMEERRRLRVLGQRVEAVFEIQGIQRGGRLLDLEVSEADILWKGRPAIQGVFRDVTERKQAEQALRRYAERLEVLRAIDRALLSAQSSSTIAEAAVGHIRKLIPCGWAGVLLVDREADEERLVVAAQEGARFRLPTDASYRPEDFGLGDGPEGEVQAFLFEAADGDGEAPVFGAWAEAGLPVVLRVPLYMQEALLGVVVLAAEAGQAYTLDHLNIAREVGEQLSVAVHSVRLFEAVSAAHVRLERLSHRLVEVQEQERRHIALELHDEIGQVLTALNFTLEFSDSVLAPEDEAKLEHARELVSTLTAHVRDLSLNLRPSMLDDLGLMPALIWYFERYQQQTGIRVHFDPGDVYGARFRPEVETAAYRIIQEALNNVARHAGVERVDVRVGTEAEALWVEVEDAGGGFDPKEARRRPSAGLSGMQERAVLVGGRLQVETRPGAGVRVRAVLPRQGALSRQEGEAPRTGAEG